MSSLKLTRSNSFSSRTTSQSSLFSQYNRSNYSNLSLVSSNADSNDELPESPLEHLPKTIVGSSSYGISRSKLNSGCKDKFICVLVGLPASGKSTVSSHLITYCKNNHLTKHLRCSIFNAGQVRRQMSRSSGLNLKMMNNSSEDLFNPKNSNKKEKYARITLDNLFRELFEDKCDLAIFDATNSTYERRRYIFDQIEFHQNSKQCKFNIIPIVIQVSCSHQSFIKYNIHNKSFNQDYFDKPYHFAIEDFARRLQNYISQFTPFTGQEFEDLKSQQAGNKNSQGLFFFNVSNAGLSTPSIDTLNYFRDTNSEFTRQFIKSLNQFTKNYSMLFGHKYINRVKEFFATTKTVDKTESSTVYRHVCISRFTDHLSVLNEVVNDDYIKLLQIDN